MMDTNWQELHTTFHQLAYLRTLIQLGKVKEATQLLQEAPELGVYEESDQLDWNCIYTYAVEMIDDDQALIALLNTYRFDIFLYFLRTSPMAAAKAAGRAVIVEHLRKIGLDAPSVRDF